MKTKLNALAVLANRAQAKLIVGLLAASAGVARADVTSADVAPVVTAITAAIALVVLIGNAKLLVKVAVRVYGWLAAAMR